MLGAAPPRLFRVAERNFRCDLSGNCWCAEETAKLPMPAAGDDCLCRECLRKAASGGATVIANVTRTRRKHRASTRTGLLVAALHEALSAILLLRAYAGQRCGYTDLQMQLHLRRPREQQQIAVEIPDDKIARAPRFCLSVCTKLAPAG